MKKSFWRNKQFATYYGESKYIPYSNKNKQSKDEPKMNYNFTLSFNIDIFTLIGSLVAVILWVFVHVVCN